MIDTQKLEEDLLKEIETTNKTIEELEIIERKKQIYKNYGGEDKVILFKEISDRIKGNLNKEEVFYTGFKQFDDIISGFRPEQLVTISAIQKSGKTSFCMDLTDKFKDHNVLWFPFEESATELIRKFIEKGLEPPHAVTPNVLHDYDIDWIEERIFEAIEKYNTKIVIIDHLEYVVPFSNDAVQMTSKTMRALKGIAKKMGIVLFLIAHLKKVKMDSQPTMEDIKGSTSVPQQADTCILLWRETKKEDGQVVITNNVNVSVQANRRFGKTGNVKMVYDNGHFTEQEWESEVSNSLANW